MIRDKIFAYKNYIKNNFFRNIQTNKNKHLANYIETRLPEYGDKNVIIKNIKEKGYFLFKNFFDYDLNKKISDEFDFAIFNKKNNFSNNNSNTIQVRYLNKHELLDDNLIWSFEIFNSKIFKEILNKIFDEKYVYNSQIFYQKTGITNNPLAGEAHYDKFHQIKIWIFVNDVDENNGAIELFDETHFQNSKKRFINYKNKTEINNNVLDNFTQKKGSKIIGPKGSVLIFNSDLYHRATNITKGERKIIRGHSMSLSTLKYIYESQSGMSSH